MDISVPGLQRAVRIGTVTGLTLAVLGIGALIIGTALYDAGTLAFPIGAQIAIVVVAVALGTLPCLLLLRATRVVHTGNLTESRSMAIAGGIVLLPGIPVAALFKVFANPCWDNPTCTGGTSLADTLLGFGIALLLLVEAVTLLALPTLMSALKRFAGRSNQV